MHAWSETVKSLLISYNLPFFGTRPKFKLFTQRRLIILSRNAARESRMVHSRLQTRLAHIYFH